MTSKLIHISVLECGRSRVQGQVRSNQRLYNWYFILS